MRPRRRAHFDLDPAEARRAQERLARRAAALERPASLPPLPWRVAGADVAYAGGRAFACVVLVEVPSFRVLAEAYAERPAPFPYVPGLLAYREGPALLDAFARVPRPDVAIFDAAGLAHPRRFGLARHLGYLLDLPSVGCAKSVLVGRHARLGRRRGARRPLLDDGDVVGVALRTREGVRPVYVSVGWRLTLERCVEVVLASGAGMRLPEPTRLADLRVEAWKRRAR
jgi:deoxyribonuclease V